MVTCKAQILNPPKHLLLSSNLNSVLRYNRIEMPHLYTFWFGSRHVEFLSYWEDLYSSLVDRRQYLDVIIGDQV